MDAPSDCFTLHAGRLHLVAGASVYLVCKASFLAEGLVVLVFVRGDSGAGPGLWRCCISQTISGVLGQLEFYLGG